MWEWVRVEGHAVDLLSTWDEPLDLVVTDPPYAFGGSGQEHELTASVAVTLRECAKRLKRGSWFVVFCASSWRSVSYMIESVRGLVSPVRFGSWVKPVATTKVSTVGWSWTTVTVIAMRKGPKNRLELESGHPSKDWILSEIVRNERRGQLPSSVATWAVAPFVIPNGIFLDPFAGSGALPKAAAKFGMRSFGFEIDKS